VFSSAEAARKFLASLGLGDEWHVNEFSTGDLISLLLALRERVGWVLLNPSPGYLSAEGSLATSMDGDNFINFLTGD